MLLLDAHGVGYSFGYAISSLVGIVVIGAIYFLPAWLARKKRQAVTISLLNLVLGWTVFGWIGLLIWAISADSPKPVVAQQAVPALSVADELFKLQALRDAGSLSEDEFQQQRQRLLARA